MTSDNSTGARFDLLGEAVAKLDHASVPTTSRHEHDRFAVYSRALDDPSLRELLVATLSEEEDKSLQHAMFVSLLEQTPYQEHSKILVHAPESEFLTRRSREVGVVEEVAEKPSLTDTERVTIRDSSDWLQRHLIESSRSLAVLETLAQSGNTNRIRHGADRKVDDLRRQHESDLIEHSDCPEVLGRIATSGSRHKTRKAASRTLRTT